MQKGIQKGVDNGSSDDDEFSDHEKGHLVRRRTTSDGNRPRISTIDSAKSASVVLAHLKDAGGLFKKRTIHSLLVSLGLANVYAMRINLSEAVEPMKNHYGWTNHQQGYVLSSFFWGYIVFQIPGAILAARFGGKPVFGFGVLGTAILTLILPLCASRLWLLCFVRAWMGFFESVTYPAITHMYTVWAPSTERTWHVAFTNAGAYIGTAIAFPIAGALIGIHKDSDDVSTTWPWVFYGFGVFGIAWWVAWQLLAASTPADHPTISTDERQYIEQTTKEDPDQGEKIVVVKSSKTPWFAICTHPVAWCIYTAHFAHNFGMYMLMTELPKYLDEVLGFTIKDAGFIAVLPYIGQFVVALAIGKGADALVRRTSVRTTRLAIQIGEYIFAGGFLIIAGWMTNKAAAVTFLTLSVAVSGVGSAGFGANYVDVSPHCAGALFGVGNVIGNVAGILAPIIAADVLGDDTSGSGSAPDADAPIHDGHHPDAYHWRGVFYVAAGVYAFAGVVFALLMRGKPVEALN